MKRVMRAPKRKAPIPAKVLRQARDGHRRKAGKPWYLSRGRLK